MSDPNLPPNESQMPSPGGEGILPSPDQAPGSPDVGTISGDLSGTDTQGRRSAEADDAKQRADAAREAAKAATSGDGGKAEGSGGAGTGSADMGEKGQTPKGGGQPTTEQTQNLGPQPGEDGHIDKATMDKLNTSATKARASGEWKDFFEVYDQLDTDQQATYQEFGEYKWKEPEGLPKIGPKDTLEQARAKTEAQERVVTQRLDGLMEQMQSLQSKAADPALDPEEAAELREELYATWEEYEGVLYAMIDSDGPGEDTGQQLATEYDFLAHAVSKITGGRVTGGREKLFSKLDELNEGAHSEENGDSRQEYQTQFADLYDRLPPSLQLKYQKKTLADLDIIAREQASNGRGADWSEFYGKYSILTPAQQNAYAERLGNIIGEVAARPTDENQKWARLKNFGRRITFAQSRANARAQGAAESLIRHQRGELHMDANGNFIDNPALNKEYDAIAREEYDSMATDEARRELALDLPSRKKGRGLRMRRIARNFIPRYTENALREFEGRGPDPLSMRDTYVPAKTGVGHKLWLGFKWGVIGLPWLANRGFRALGRNTLHTPEGVVPLWGDNRRRYDALQADTNSVIERESQNLYPETRARLLEQQAELGRHLDPHDFLAEREDASYSWRKGPRVQSFEERGHTLLAEAREENDLNKVLKAVRETRERRRRARSQTRP